MRTKTSIPISDSAWGHVYCEENSSDWDGTSTTTRYFKPQSNGNDYGVGVWETTVKMVNGYMTRSSDGLATQYLEPSSDSSTTLRGVYSSDYKQIASGLQSSRTFDSYGNILTDIQTVVESPNVILSSKSYCYTGSDSAYLHPLKLSYVVTDSLTGLMTTNLYDCCGLSYVGNPDGSSLSYNYDTDTRQRTNVLQYYGGTNSIQMQSVLDGLGRRIGQYRVSTNGIRSLVSGTGYDVLGRVIYLTNGLGGVITISFSSVGTQPQVTTTYPDGGTKIELYNNDGSLDRVTGTAVHGVHYLYGAEVLNGICYSFQKEVKLLTGGTDSSEWTKTYFDGGGRVYMIVHSADSGTPTEYRYYNTAGRLWKTVDPDGVVTFYIYNDLGEMEYAIQPSVQSMSLTESDLWVFDSSMFTSYDRITYQVKSYIDPSGSVPAIIQNETYKWEAEDTTTGTLVEQSRQYVNGLQSWRSVFAGDTNSPSTVHSQTTLLGASKVVQTTNPDGSYINTDYSFGRAVSVTKMAIINGTPTSISDVSFGYDSLGRQNTLTDSRNGTTTYQFDNADNVLSITTPAPGVPGQLAQTTSKVYDTMSRLTGTVEPDGTTVTNLYYSTGELFKTYGSRTYPVAYEYDYAGRMAKMTTWSSFSSATGARVTTWTYNSQGLLKSKDYPDLGTGNPPSNLGTTGPTYTYTPGGRLSTRTWLRGTVTTYTYGFQYGNSSTHYEDLISVAYSGESGVTTPGLNYSYDRMGRQSTITVSGGTTTTLSYDNANNLLSESWVFSTICG
jgi:hypothetical protein